MAQRREGHEADTWFPHQREHLCLGVRGSQGVFRLQRGDRVDGVGTADCGRPRQALTLFAGLADWPPERRNTIRYTFFHPAARELFADWDRAAETTAAHLRSLAASTPADPDVSALITELLDGSPEFARLWQRHDVRQRRGEAKPFRHPRVGEFTLTNEVLHLADGQRMSVYQAEPGSRDHDALTLLSMIASGNEPEDAAR